MTIDLNLTRRLVKGEPLTAEDHDDNLDKLEGAFNNLTPSDIGGAAVDDARFEQTLVTVRNQTGTLIPKGVAVSFAGTLGASGQLLIKRAIADGSEPGYVFLGVTAQPIANGEQGVVLTWGKIFDVNTNAFQEGDILWVNPAVPGGFTAVEPEAPNLKLPVAVVVNRGIANGILIVRSATGQRLQDLHDVEANGAKVDRDALLWNNTAGRWEPDALTASDVGADPAGSAQAVADSLGDAALLNVGTTAGTVAAGDDGRLSDSRTPTAHKTTHATGGSDELTPADIGAEVAGAAQAVADTLATVATSGDYDDLTNKPTLGTAAAEDVGTGAGDVVQLDSSARLPAVDGSQLTNLPSPGASAIDDLSDVSITTPADGEVLTYDDNSGEWVNAAPAGGGAADPAGSDTQIQFNDDGSFGASADLTWDDTDKELGVGGDINLDDGGTFTTTLQMVTATADRTISFPDATGTVALVAGSSGQLIYNAAGALAGGGVFDATRGTLGYPTGGTVTQASNKSTGVTLNGASGRITLNAEALAAGTTVSFTLTNSAITANDLLLLNHVSGGTAGAYTLNAQAGAGTASISVRNVTGGSLSEAIVIGFAVLKA